MSNQDTDLPENSAQPTVSPTPPEENSKITLIHDPFGINTLRIANIQNQEDELPPEELGEDLGEGLLDEDGENEGNTEDDLTLVSPEEAEEQLNSLARAIHEATELEAQENTALLKEVVDAIDPLAQAERIAREIEEDQALQREIAAEAEAIQKEMGEESDAEQEEFDPELQAALPQSRDLDEMQSCIETLLFMSDKPLSLTKLQEMLGPELPHSLFQEAITALRDNYAATRHGIEIIEVAGGLQLRTKPGRAPLARKLAKVQTQRLSSGAMETLAIIAYKQPAMKEDVDQIRGVDSSYFVRQLLDKKLIQISGRSELPGRPMVYSTTDDFLQLFGLKDVSALPSLRELEQMIPSSQSDRPDDPDYGDPRIREMRRLVDQMKSDTSTLLNYDPREDEKILKDIRERVQSIPTSTPYLEEQKALEKQALEMNQADASV